MVLPGEPYGVQNAWQAAQKREQELSDRLNVAAEFDSRSGRAVTAAEFVRTWAEAKRTESDEELSAATAAETALNGEFDAATAAARQAKAALEAKNAELRQA